MVCNCHDGTTKGSERAKIAKKLPFFRSLHKACVEPPAIFTYINFQCAIVITLPPFAKLLIRQYSRLLVYFLKMKRDKKDEEANASNPFVNLDKTTVLQEVCIVLQVPLKSAFFNFFKRQAFIAEVMRSLIVLCNSRFRPIIAAGLF